MKHIFGPNPEAVTLVHCPFDCPDMPQKAHVAAIFLWSYQEFSATSNSN